MTTWGRMGELISLLLLVCFNALFLHKKKSRQVDTLQGHYLNNFAFEHPQQPKTKPNQQAIPLHYSIVMFQKERGNVELL